MTRQNRLCLKKCDSVFKPETLKFSLNMDIRVSVKSYFVLLKRLLERRHCRESHSFLLLKKRPEKKRSDS